METSVRFVSSVGVRIVQHSVSMVSYLISRALPISFVGDMHKPVLVGEHLGTPAVVKWSPLLIIFIAERKREESSNLTYKGEVD